MPLKQGSSDKVIQDNIRCILQKDGCGYDPPYMDPARDEYTPAQAAAIAYAKAGRRNNTGSKKTSSSKQTKSVAPQELKTPTKAKEEPKGGSSKPPAQSATNTDKTDTKFPDIKIPEGWTPQMPGGDTASAKKNQPPENTTGTVPPQAGTKPSSSISKADNDQMKKDVTEGYAHKWGSSGAAKFITDHWDDLKDNEKKAYHDQAKEYLQDKAKKEGNKPPQTKSPTPSNNGGNADDADNKMLQDILNSSKYNNAAKDAIKANWDKSSPEDKQKMHNHVTGKTPEPSASTPVPAPPTSTPSKPSTPEGWNPLGEPTFEGNNISYQGKIYKPTKVLPGSTAPKLYSDEDGNPRFVVKEGGKNGGEGQNIAEHTANKLYGMLRYDFPTGAVNSRLINGKLVNDFIPNAKTVGDLSDEELQGYNVKSKIKKSLVVDALVANWDYAGLNNDNMMVDGAGKVLRIDSGGTFNYRAQGDSKDFTSVPMELWSLRSSAQGQRFWNDATDSDYEDLWTNRVDTIRDRDDDILKVIKDSNLSPEVKQAFANRVQILSIAADEAGRIYDRDNVNWREVDEIMRRAFLHASVLDPSDPDWGNKVRQKMRNNLDNAFPDSPAPGLDFKLPSETGKYNELSYKYTVKAAEKQASGPYAGEYGGNPEACMKLSPDEKYSIRKYTGDTYMALNAWLRGKDGYTDSSNASITFTDNDKKFFGQLRDNMDSGLSNLPDYEDEQIFHRMNGINPKYTKDIEIFQKLRPGDYFETTGFDSYTDQHEGDEQARNEIMDTFYRPHKFSFITVYKGKNIKGVAPISDAAHERESIFQRGKKLKVTDVKDEDINDYPGIDWMGNETKTGKVRVIYVTDFD